MTQYEYKVIQIRFRHNAIKSINSEAEKGWRYKNDNGSNSACDVGYVLLERPIKKWYQRKYKE